MLKNTREDVIYASILADGKIHIPANEGEEGAILRTYETSDGKSGEKWERVYTQLIGKITKQNFWEGDYGTQYQITIEDGDQKPVILSLKASSNYGLDLMKKIFNVNLEKKIKIVPYSFEDKTTKKTRKGITVWQFNEEEKKAVRVNSYFYNIETKKSINGFPEPKKGRITKTNPTGKLSSDQWQLYFAGDVKEFLVDKITSDFKIETEVENNDEWDDFADPEIVADEIDIE